MLANCVGGRELAAVHHMVSASLQNAISLIERVIPNGPSVRARCLQRANRPGGICSAALQ
jgi:hypothetical protein